jgi:hypothetical protein
MMTFTPIGQSQRDKETGEPDDATSIKSGSEGGWEKRPKGPRSQPTRPNDDQRHQLEALLTLPEGKRRSQFDQLRQGPRHVSSPSMIAALERYEALRHLGIRELDFSRIPPVWIQSLSRYATTGWATEHCPYA